MTAKIAQTPSHLVELEKVREKLNGKGIPALVKIVKQAMKFQRDELLAAGIAVVEIESQISDYFTDDPEWETAGWFLDTVRPIGTGELHADVACRFAGRPYTFAALRAMSPERQARFLGMSNKEVEEFFQSRKEERQADRFKGGNGAHATAKSPVVHESSVPTTPPDKPNPHTLTKPPAPHRSEPLTPELAVKQALEVVNKCTDRIGAAQALMHRLVGILAEATGRKE